MWIMVPAGHVTESVINELADLLEPGDAIIDGGNPTTAMTSGTPQSSRRRASVLSIAEPLAVSGVPNAATA